MIRFGLRLTLRGGREAAVRLAVTAAAMALGVSLLLITLAGINALNAQNARAAWLSTSANSARTGSSQAAPDPLWWLSSADQFGSQVIYRMDVAATGSRSPIPPGIPHPPGPGQFYASPTLSQLLRSTPASQLGDRFGGRQIGTIRPLALPAPDSLIIIIGHTAGQLSKAAGAAQVRRIQTSPGGSGHCWLERRQHDGPRIHPRPRGTGAVLPPARLHRHSDPAFGGTPGAAVRRPAPGRRDAPAGLGTISRRSIRRRPRRDGDRLHAVLPAPPGPGGRSLLHRHAVRPRRPVAPAGRHPARRHRRPGRGGGGGTSRAAARADLAARGYPAGHAAGSPGRTG